VHSTDHVEVIVLRARTYFREKTKEHDRAMMELVYRFLLLGDIVFGEFGFQVLS
jgi:hypothetical protein